MRGFTLILAFAAVAFAQEAPGNTSLTVERLLDRIVLKERSFLERLQSLTPVVETYIQETPAPSLPDEDLHPTKDHYFLGRFHIGPEIEYETLIERTDPQAKSGRRTPKNAQPGLTFLPRGFAQMALIDLHDFNRLTYRFEYIRREFLGEARCLVFDVAPVRRDEAGRFMGRIWVEDKDNAIVRFNGTYVPAPPAKNAPPAFYFHFDSWRVNVLPGEWIPAQIYIEEEGNLGPHSEEQHNPTPRFKAQTRIWDYAASPSSKLDELTKILIESEQEVKDQTSSKDSSPLESQRSWERQAEENVLARLEKGGLLAPKGPVDEVLNTVVNNLITTGNLNVDAECRVLLTTPIETFSIGHTIVISRGLLDVLPDEASLALVLADELSHIALGHRTPTNFAFHNQTMVTDAELLRHLHLERTPMELEAAGRKTIEIMKASPYQKMANAGLFLKSLASRSAQLPKLLAANIGNQVANADALARLAEFAAAAPALEVDKLEQIAALPLGSRVKLNPWDDKIVLVKTKPISLLSPREKMPFEVTPFALYLTRVDAESAQRTTAP
jgi:hypothetical protein